MNKYSVLCHPSQPQQKIENGYILYQQGTLPPHLYRYEDALNPATWQSHYQPFSAVIANNKFTELILIRDHLGLEPLYFAQHPNPYQLNIATTLPDLLTLLPKTPNFNKDEITELFSLSHDYTDNTLYQGIYRVEPGHFLHFRANATMIKHTYWALTPQGDTLHYPNANDYVEHFSILLQEAIQQAVLNHHPASIAAEFSAGIDSTSIYCAAHQYGLNPKLFMHNAPEGSDAERRYQNRYELAFLQQYPEACIERIQAEDFDALSVFREYANWFAGPAPYLFYMFANPIHRAIEKQQYKILLSGFGGDQGVSTPMPPNFFIPELFAEKNLKTAWNVLFEPNISHLRKLKRLLSYSVHLHPKIYQGNLSIQSIQHKILNLGKRDTEKRITTPHPYTKYTYKTIREAECSLLQGPQSHEIRMRIEYSSIVSKKMGFEYRYPLLYPKLLEFFLSIPISEKRYHGTGRYLIRRYLKQFFPDNIFSRYLKKEGLDIVPASMAVYEDNFKQGQYQQDFSALPFNHLIKNTSFPIRLRHSIKGYMLKQIEREY